MLFRSLLGLPSRGQRTKANFRKNRRKSSGIQKKGPKAEAAAKNANKGKDQVKDKGKKK